MRDEETDPQNLGNLARAFGDDVTGVHINRALEYQRENPGTKIGDALVATNAIDAATRDELLKKQKAMRSGKFSRADVQAMMDYAARKTRTVSDAATTWLGNLRKR